MGGHRLTFSYKDDVRGNVSEDWPVRYEARYKKVRLNITFKTFPFFLVLFKCINFSDFFQTVVVIGSLVLNVLSVFIKSTSHEVGPITCYY